MTVDLSRTVEHNGDILEWVCMTSPAGYLSWTDVIRNLNILSKDEATTTYGEPLTWREPNIESVRSDTEFFENTLDEWIEILFLIVLKLVAPTTHIRLRSPETALPFTNALLPRINFNF